MGLYIDTNIIKLNKDVFESVYSFLNRNGVHLLLGVEDKGGGV